MRKLTAFVCVRGALTGARPVTDRNTLLEPRRSEYADADDS